MYRHADLVVGICTNHRSDATFSADVRTQNPLQWVLRALNKQTVRPGLVIVMKQGKPTRNFQSVVKEARCNFGVRVEYFDQAEPLSTIRNELVMLAYPSPLWILDDDAILTGYETLETLMSVYSAHESSISVIQGPVYRRSLIGQRCSPTRKVAHINLHAHIVTHYFDTTSSVGHAELLPIENLCLANCVINTEYAASVANFQPFPWSGVYGQESVYGLSLASGERTPLFFTDQRAAVINLKHGAPMWVPSQNNYSSVSLPGEVSFELAADISSQSSEITVSRKNSEGFFVDYLSGIGAIFVSNGDSASTRAVMARLWLQFVECNSIYHPFVLPLNSETSRKRAYATSIDRLNSWFPLRLPYIPTSKDIELARECDDPQETGSAPKWI